MSMIKTILQSTKIFNGNLFGLMQMSGNIDTKDQMGQLIYFKLIFREIISQNLFARLLKLNILNMMCIQIIRHIVNS